jgi:hypothetical protein
MRKISRLKSAIIAVVGLFLTLTLLQCKKVGVLADQLDRAFLGTADSTVFAPFYDETKIAVADVTADAHDIIKVKGVQSTIKEYCGIATCHGGPINPKLATYDQIKSLVTPGNPEGSKIWNLITTNDLNRAMPPVNKTHELSETDKTIIYNWIKNGAKEFPALEDFRPAAMRVITSGCASANCHNVLTSTGSWARASLIPGLTSSDTTMFTHVRPSSTSYYCQLTNPTLRNTVWSAYKDSVRKFYSDTLTNASFRPYKTFSTPVVKSSVRGSLSSYDDIVMDIWYPKSLRSNTSVVYSSGGTNYYVRGDYLNISGTSYFLARIDSTLLPANPRTGAYSSSNSGDMAYSDGGITPSEIALIKAWYFADPNIPDVWKYGQNNVGIVKFKKTGNVITKH